MIISIISRIGLTNRHVFRALLDCINSYSTVLDTEPKAKLYICILEGSGWNLAQTTGYTEFRGFRAPSRFPVQFLSYYNRME
jgi:hypothetical protein